MVRTRRFAILLATALASATSFAQDEYKVGLSVALSGYGASIDNPWKDGVALAAEERNRRGGILGRKVSIAFEDMRSEPAETVAIVRRLISSDKVKALTNGCSSAGNAAAAPLVDRAQIPMIVCSILPPRVEDQKWAFSLLPLPAFDVETRFAHMQKSGIKRIGLLFDPTPYSAFGKKIAEANAAKYGLQIVGAEQFRLTDADMTAYVTKLRAAGAEAVMKLGSGSTTITAAKAIKQLGLTIPLYASTVDSSLVQASSEVIGAQFYFPAQRIQVIEVLPKDDAGVVATSEFLAAWKKKFGDRDPTWGSRGWDAFNLLMTAIERSKSFEGSKVRDAIESVVNYQGASGELNFSPTQHNGVTKNPYYLAQMIDGKIRLAR